MLIEASLIDGLTYSPQRIKPLLAALPLVEEVADRLFDQFVTASIVAVGEFAFDLFCQIRRQGYVHDRLSSLYAFEAPASQRRTEPTRLEGQAA